MAFRYSPKIVTDGLVLCLDAANPKSFVSGSTTWNDLTTNFNNGTLVNGPTYSLTNGGNIVFDGTDDYGTISNSNSLIFGNGDFTVNIWMKFPVSSIGEASGWGPIVSKGCATSAPAGTWWLAQNSTTTNRVTLNISSTAGGAFVSAVTTGVLSDGWHNICAQRNGSTSTIYADGVLQSTDVSSDSDLSSTGPLTICTTFTTSLTGKRTSTSIGNIQLYNRALSLTEIQQNYNTIKTRFGL